MIRSIRPILIACLSLSLSLTMVACGGDDDGDDESGTPDAGGDDDTDDAVDVLAASACTDPTETITTTGLAFTNGNVTISPGDTILFMPAGGHDMKSTEDEFDSGPLNTPACLRFNDAGEYPYICSAHPSMMGTVTVE
jgi:plastocyanin